MRSSYVGPPFSEEQALYTVCYGHLNKYPLWLKCVAQYKHFIIAFSTLLLLLATWFIHVLVTDKYHVKLMAMAGNRHLLLTVSLWNIYVVPWWLTGPFSYSIWPLIKYSILCHVFSIHSLIARAPTLYLHYRKICSVMDRSIKMFISNMVFFFL